MRWTDPVDGRPLRHARVWLDAATWRSSVIAVDAVDAVDRETLARWIAAGRALVACRRDPSTDHAVRLGAVLPDRRRIALVVEAGAAMRVAAPLALIDVVDTAPAAWRAALRRLVADAGQVGTHFRCYGSLAWQATTGEVYVGPGSDVDLLWSATSPRQVDDVVALLLAWEADSGLRADGELLTAAGGGIAWREWAAKPTRVLVKQIDRVSLQRVDRCLDVAA